MVEGQGWKVLAFIDITIIFFYQIVAENFFLNYYERHIASNLSYVPFLSLVVMSSHMFGCTCPELISLAKIYALSLLNHFPLLPSSSAWEPSFYSLSL